MQAGLTGHLILTTVHGQSAAGVFARLVEMLIERFILITAVGCLSRRLVEHAVHRVSPPRLASSIIVNAAEAGIACRTAFTTNTSAATSARDPGLPGRLPIAGDLLVKLVRDRRPVNAREAHGRAGHQLAAVSEGIRRSCRDRPDARTTRRDLAGGSAAGGRMIRAAVARASGSPRWWPRGCLRSWACASA